MKRNKFAAAAFGFLLPLLISGLSAASGRTLPDLPPGMVNVSDGTPAHPVLKPGSKTGVIAVSFNRSKIPAGFTASDIHTYRLEPGDKNWKQLKRDSLDEQRSIVYSTTTGDGDFVNAILKAPETPEIQGYIPTTMNDMKVGDPGSMVQIINPPSGNYQGSANLSYHIDIPPGRQGIQPDLSIVYNSDGPNGMLGAGWSMPVSSITVDTRWGVPRFNGVNESEVYMLDGKMLAFKDNGVVKTANRYTNVARNTITSAAGVTLFRPKKETDFQRIQRIGNSPSSYYWIITTKTGTRYYYGGVDKLNTDAVLNDPAKGIAEWRLVRIADIFGNHADFEYSKVTGKPYSWLYLSKIDYTLSDMDRNVSYYEMTFGYDKDIKTDSEVLNGRYGFLTAPNAWRLSSIAINRINNADLRVPLYVRGYKFGYKPGAFGQLLLKWIAQTASDDTEFNRHNFTYYNEDGAAPFYVNAPVTVNSKGLAGDVPGVLGITNNSPSAIGGSKSSGNSAGLYVGVGSGNPASVNLSAGVQYSNAWSASNGLNTLVDMDGDGRPDKLYVKDGGLWFEKNISTADSVKFDPAPIRIQGAPADFLVEKSRTTSWAAKAFFGLGSASYEEASSETSIDTYLTDVNGDGFVDIVQGTVVYFNTGVSNKVLTFSTLSSKTHAPMNGTGHPNAAFTYDNRIDVSLEKGSPLQEVVRMWEAPFDGTVDITGTAALLKPDHKDSEYEDRDGARIIMEHDKSDGSVERSAAVPIDKNDFGSHPMNWPGIIVHKGDRIFFRAQSGLNSDANGAWDQIAWDPGIRYTASNEPLMTDLLKTPAAGRYDYKASGDFLLSDPEPFALPPDVKEFNLAGIFSKAVTADTLLVSIQQLKKDPAQPYLDKKGNQLKDADGNPVYHYNFEHTLYSHSFKPEELVNVLNTKVRFDDNSADKKIRLVVTSNVNIDLNGVKWAPEIAFLQHFQVARFDNANNPLPPGDTTITVIRYVSPFFAFNDTLRSEGRFTAATAADMTYSIYPGITLNNNAVNGSFYLAIKTPSGVLAKVPVSYAAGQLAGAKPLKVTVPANTPFLVSLEAAVNPMGKTSDDAYQTSCDNILAAYALFAAGKASAVVLKKADYTAAPAGRVLTVNGSGDYIVRPRIKSGNARVPGLLVIELWLNGKLQKMGTQDTVIRYSGNSYTYPLNPLVIPLHAGDQLSVEIVGATDDYLNAAAPAADFVAAIRVSADFITARRNKSFGPLYKSWGQFIYNDMDNRSARDIRAGDLKVNRDAAQNVDADAYSASIRSAVAAGNKPAQNADIENLSVANAIFFPMLPHADADKRCWMGAKDSVYLEAQKMSPSRLGINNVKKIYPFTMAASTDSDNSYARAVTKVTAGDSRTTMTGYSFLSKNDTKGSSRMIADYIDLNGDRYPDILTPDALQVTNPTGALDDFFGTPQQMHNVTESASGMGISGGNGRSRPSQNNFGNKNRTTGGAAPNADVAAESGQQAAGNIGATANITRNDENTEAMWMDINGDGLPDKITSGGYDINLGYNRYAHYGADMGKISRSHNTSLSPGITAGFSYDHNSFSGGAGLSFSDGTNEGFLQDMNGDGLADKVEIRGDELWVAVNTGSGFLDFRDWTTIARGGTSYNALGAAASFATGFLPGGGAAGWLDAERTKFNSSNGVSLGGTLSFGFSIWIVKVVISPSFYHSWGLGRTIRQVADINGDGLPDILYSTSEGKLEVSLSNLGRTNKLMQVDNPLGGSFRLEYAHSENTPRHPNGKWVMSALEVQDGVKEDRAAAGAGFDSRKLFKYSDGYYDAFERDFTGFGKTTMTELNYDLSPYRQVVTTYATDSYYHAGQLLEQVVQDPVNDRKFAVTRNTYSVPPVSNVYRIGDFAAETGIQYCPLKTTCTGSYEGGPNLVWQTKSTYEYNGDNGLLEHFSYRENPASPGDDRIDYKTTVTYEPADADNYIFGQPNDVKTISADGVTLRHVSATYYSWNDGGYNFFKRRIRTFNVFLSPGIKETTSFTYDYRYGNLTGKTQPDGLSYTYTYDNSGNGEVNSPYTSNSYTLVTGVYNNSFQYGSTTVYDYRYAEPVELTDINRNNIGYELDKFGRVIRIVGPKQCANPITAEDCPKTTFTIKVDFSLKGTLPAKRLSAMVTHFDEANPGSPGIRTINFTDGYKRSVQVKTTAALTDGKGIPDRSTNWVVSGRSFFDAFGRQVQNYYPVKDATDGMDFSAARDQTAGPSTYTYDLLDRVTAFNYPDGPHFSTVYATEASRLAATTTTFNAKGSGDQKRKVVSSGSGLKEREILYQGDGSLLQTAYTYDGLHQLLRVTDNMSHATNYTYDQAGNMLSSEDPDGGSTFFRYDQTGQLTDKIIAGADIQYFYNKNYLIRTHYPLHAENDAKFVYGSGNAHCSNCNGKLIYREDASGAESFTWDSLGQVRTQTRTLIAPFTDKVFTFRTDFTYDTWNRVRQIIYPDDEHVVYRYNTAGMLSSVTGTRPNVAGVTSPYAYVKSIGYNEFGQRTYMAAGDNSVAEFTYEPARRRLSAITTSGLNAASPFSTFTSSYDYDDADNLLNNTIDKGNGTNTETTQNTITYDVLNRVRVAKGAWKRGEEAATYALTVGYDQVFNVASKQLEIAGNGIDINYADIFTYQNKPHQLSLLTETVNRNNEPAYAENNRELYAYDAAGNDTLKNTGDKSLRTGINQRKILWDEERHINAVSVNGYISHYIYDNSGERSVKLSEENEGIFVNGKYGGAKTTPATFVLYAGPYYSMRNGVGLYTKHIYIGSERIASQVESDLSFGNKLTSPLNQDIAVSCPIIDMANHISYNDRKTALNLRINTDYDKLGILHTVITSNVFGTRINDVEPLINPYPPTVAVTAEKLPKEKAPELLSYYYHTNQSGSTAFVTSDNGTVVQYLEYLPFGETFMEYRKNYDSQYKFSAKQEDQETGLKYFGARYYDDHSYQWLSTDPKSQAFPGMSPYIFNLNNPVAFKDKDGREPKNIREREDEYFGRQFWSDPNFDKAGSQWAGAASNVSHAMDAFTNPTSSDNPGIFSSIIKFTTDAIRITSPETRQFANKGNKMIYDDAIPKLDELSMGYRLRSEAAVRWDAKMLWEEQTLIQPLYDNLSAEGLSMVSSAAKQSPWYSRPAAWYYNIKISPFPANGDVKDVYQRWDYGMGEMYQRCFQREGLIPTPTPTPTEATQPDPTRLN